MQKALPWQGLLMAQPMRCLVANLGRVAGQRLGRGMATIPDGDQRRGDDDKQAVKDRNEQNLLLHRAAEGQRLAAAPASAGLV